MCGIVGYVGPAEALPIVLEGLRRLEYRGYDSAGVAVLDGGLTVVKRAGKLAELETALDDGGHPSGTVAMGHTRWATHGAPTDRNAHPHLDCSGTVAVIHNGIIENFQQLRARLEKDGHALVSETDTELVAHLIEERLRAGDPLVEAVRVRSPTSRERIRSWCCPPRSPGCWSGSRSPRPWWSGSARTR